MRVLERSRAVLGGLQPFLAVSGALQDPSDSPGGPLHPPWRLQAAPRAAPGPYSDIYIYTH